jgi:hypothetical protein
MTARELYYLNRHLKRLNARNKWKAKRHRASASCMSAALKEYYGHILYGKDQVKYDLIVKFESKVSRRLLSEKTELREKAKIQAEDLMNKLVFSRNPFLSITKGTDFLGGSYVAPLFYNGT